MSTDNKNFYETGISLACLIYQTMQQLNIAWNDSFFYHITKNILITFLPPIFRYSLSSMAESCLKTTFLNAQSMAARTLFSRPYTYPIRS